MKASSMVRGVGSTRAATARAAMSQGSQAENLRSMRRIIARAGSHRFRWERRKRGAEKRTSFVSPHPSNFSYYESAARMPAGSYKEIVMNVTAEPQGAATVIRVVGSLDALTAPTLTEFFAGQLQADHAR